MKFTLEITGRELNALELVGLATLITVLAAGAVAQWGTLQHRDSGTSAIDADQLDGNDASAFVDVSGDTLSGDLDLGGNQLKGVGSTQCSASEAILGDGSCGSTGGGGGGDRNLSQVLTSGNEANQSIDVQGNQVQNLTLDKVSSDPSSPAVGQVWYRTDKD